MQNTRDYNAEKEDALGHAYSDDFDDILRPYMMQTFRPFFRPGKVLEMGCYHGFFTSLIQKEFDDITTL